MSRLYFTAEMKYTDGIKIPVFKIYTGDHTGGSYNIGGIHPSTIAKMAGKGPKIGDQERFDVKFHVNKTRANASLIVNTSKHLPSVSWSTDSGLGINLVRKSIYLLIIFRKTPFGPRRIRNCYSRQEFFYEIFIYSSKVETVSR